MGRQEQCLLLQPHGGRAAAAGGGTCANAARCTTGGAAAASAVEASSVTASTLRSVASSYLAKAEGPCDMANLESPAPLALQSVLSSTARASKQIKSPRRNKAASQVLPSDRAGLLGALNGHQRD